MRAALPAHHFPPTPTTFASWLHTSGGCTWRYGGGTVAKTRRRKAARCFYMLRFWGDFIYLVGAEMFRSFSTSYCSSILNKLSLRDCTQSVIVFFAWIFFTSKKRYLTCRLLYLSLHSFIICFTIHVHKMYIFRKLLKILLYKSPNLGRVAVCLPLRNKIIFKFYIFDTVIQFLTFD